MRKRRIISKFALNTNLIMTLLTSILLAAALSLPLSSIDTRVGSTFSDSPTASIFGAEGEVFGNTIPCVTEPNGMTFWTASTTSTEKKGVGPYYYNHDTFLGFRSSHWLEGGATQEYGSFTILPGSQPSAIDHGRETANPDYYSLELGGSPAELTARSHSSIMRFCADRLTLTVNSDRGEGWIQVDTAAREIRACNPVHRIYQGWGLPAGFSGYIVLRYQDDILSFSADNHSAELVFRTGGVKTVKAACSFTSAEAAAANLEAEIPHWDFDRTRSELAQIWQGKLGQIRFDDQSPESIHFYTSLWRSSLLPRTVSDCGEPADYDDFSMWDTYRALHPLLTILEPAKTAQMIQALLRKYDRGGWLPIFPCWGSYTSAMIGDHCISMIADAWVKGIRGFDRRKAYRAMRQNAFEVPGGENYLSDSLYQDGRGRRALPSYLKYGYVPLEDTVHFAYHQREQVSRTLEYAYDDWCLSRIARRTGHWKDARILARRARNWRNVFDPRTRYPQGRHADGSFLQEDNYLVKTRFITEGTPCHYSWYVPHDVDGLVEFMGREEFISRLDSMFTQKRYWHGNEPCHQIAYMYDYVGEHSKAVQVVRDILRSEYRNTPGGLSGNDDAGQMSAWYVFSCLGFYPVCPGSGEYALAAPAFSNMSISLSGGRTLELVNHDTSACNYEIRFNGRRLRRPFISHRRLMKGGKLEFIPIEI